MSLYTFIWMRSAPRANDTTPAFRSRNRTIRPAQEVIRVSAACTRPGSAYQLAERQATSKSTVVDLGGVSVGAAPFVVMAGPCSVESRAQLLDTADAVRRAGASVLRGGAFKPRTSPYAFQGLGSIGLHLLEEAGCMTGLPVVTEVMEPAQVDAVARSAAVLQIGARNMQNFPLLRAVGRTDSPVLLKRGMAATIEEWLLAAEYILAAGNPNVILCERGIRTFETATRNTLDLSAIPLVKQRSHLPVIADPSHATGQRLLIQPMALAAAAAGADGLLLEVHPEPENALCDGPQALTFADFERLMDALLPILNAIGRPLARRSSSSTDIGARELERQAA